MINSANCIKTSTDFLPDRKDETTERKENHLSPQESDGSVWTEIHRKYQGKRLDSTHFCHWPAVVPFQPLSPLWSQEREGNWCGGKGLWRDQKKLALISAVAGSSCVAQWKPWFFHLGFLTCKWGRRWVYWFTSHVNSLWLAAAWNNSWGRFWGLAKAPPKRMSKSTGPVFYRQGCNSGWVSQVCSYF